MWNSMKAIGEPMPFKPGTNHPQHRATSDMKRELSDIENVVVDEANQWTYVVTAGRQLTDGEIYSAIRVALLRRGGKRLERGETLKIATTRWD
jgi:hypothetical protein